MRTGSPPNANFKGRHRAEYAWFSISDSLPMLTISAENAAQSILGACRMGEAEVVLSFPAKVAALFQELFPELTADLLSLVNRFLPGPDGPGSIGTEKRTGAESESALSPSVLTTLTEEAARRNNELCAREA